MKPDWPSTCEESDVANLLEQAARSQDGAKFACFPICRAAKGERESKGTEGRERGRLSSADE